MWQLLKNRSFAALTTTQFLGAFNDNAFKQLVLLLAVTSAVPWIGEHPLAQASPQTLPSALFALPFVLFGALTGSIADRVSKSRIIKTAKVAEIAVMTLALVAFLLQSYVFLLVVILLMGLQSALFGPSKYGSIPELIETRDLSRGNALIQMTTMLAVILGIVLGGFLKDACGDELWLPALVFIGLAVIGTGTSLRIRRLEPADPGRRLTWNAFRHWKAAEGDRPLLLSVIGSAFFYLIAATLILVVNRYGAWLELDGVWIAGLNGLVAIGVAGGSLLAGRLSGDRIESGLVPIGLFGMALCLIVVEVDPRSVGLLGSALFGVGLFAGLFTVPIRALIQHRPRPSRKGAILGLSEVLDFTGILAASLLYLALDSGLGLGPSTMFLVLGLFTLLFTAGSLVYTSEFAIRVGLLALVHSIYRIRVRGLHKLPAEGGALLVANHVSFVDALLIGAASPRPVRFLMYRAFFDLPIVGWFARKMGAIAVSAEDSRKAKVAAIEAAAEAARDGALVCIFAEGAITRTGTMLPFARGLERIARESGAPIVPVALDRLWGSIFSFEGGRVFWKRPQRIPFPVEIAVGDPLPSDTPAWRVRNCIQELIAERRSGRDGPRGSLAWRFLRTARMNSRHRAIVDSTGASLSYRKLLIATLAMRSLFRRRLGPEERVAVFLPPGAGGAIANVTLALVGKASANLNYTMSNEALASPVATAGLKQVITSRRFLKALERSSPLPEEGTLYMEDLSKELTRADKLRGLLLALLPGRILARIASPQRSSTETATIIFSSGSTGEPKGVELTHRNVLSNVQGALQVLSVGPGDGLLGVLPFFHSFGYTITLWATLLSGAKGVYHTNPLDAKTIGALSEEHGVSIMVATPTFYGGYLRRCTPEQFAHLRIAMSGAEKLRPALADAWNEKFGVPLLEGYGATELSPVVSVNVPDVNVLGARDKGNKPGTIGRPLPGVAVRIVDSDSGELLEPGHAGLLEVKGPNVMKGYLGQPEKTAGVIRDGWYNTGDIAQLDRDGFLVITDRLARFSKIGGEMVPHGKVEDVLREVAATLSGAGASEVGDDEGGLGVVVTAVADEKKGEQLVVVHTHLPCTVDELLAGVREAGLPQLFVPRAKNFVEVEEIPTLGTGKTDLKGLKDVAREALGVHA